MRRLRALLPLLILAACDRQLHRLFEAPPPPYIRLSMAIDPSAAVLPRGGDLALTATVTRMGEDRGAVSVTIEGAPTGVTATTKASTAVGDITTTSLSLHATPDVSIGNYSITVRAHANQATDASSLLVLTVIDPPAIGVLPSKSALAIARGGIARVGLSLFRTNVTDAVSLSATSEPGITIALATNPLLGDSTTATLAVDPTVAIGEHTVTVHASADGVAGGSTTLTVNVIADPLQVLVEGDLSTPQLSAISEEVIVNSAASRGQVALSVGGLPPNVDAAFDPLSASNPATRLRLTVAGTAPAGSYPVTVHASAIGIGEATAPLTLRILPAGIAFSATPATATVFTGSAVTTALALSRTNFNGAVALSADPLPPGLTIAFDSDSFNGTAAKATLTVAPSAAPGSYTVVVHATPVGLAASAAQSASLAITVLPASSSTGNIALDWSACAMPDWVALQDGAGPWTRLAPAQGVFVGAVSSSSGAIAYVERGNSVTVRYMTRDELTAHPLDMCGQVSGARTVAGSAAFGFANEIGAYSLGGGSGRSTAAQPNFTIGGVRDGVHDLIAYSYFQNGAPSRFAIRRDVTVNAATTSIAPVDFQGTESFAAAAMAPAPTVNGPVLAGETYTHTLSYLTTAACDAGLLYTSPGFGFSNGGQVNFPLSTLALPDSVRRPDDFYLLTVFFTGNSSFRSSSIAFHAPGVRSLQLAPLLPAMSVSAISGAYERLQVAFAPLPPAYNRSIALSYDDGSRSMTVSASRAYVDEGASSLAMPDLSLVSGWPGAAGIPAGSTGSWRFRLEGNTSDGNPCAENRVSYWSGRSGAY